jgi:hypothetical protein
MDELEASDGNREVSEEGENEEISECISVLHDGRDESGSGEEEV